MMMKGREELVDRLHCYVLASRFTRIFGPPEYTALRSLAKQQRHECASRVCRGGRLACARPGITSEGGRRPTGIRPLAFRDGKLADVAGEPAQTGSACPPPGQGGILHSKPVGTTRYSVTRMTVEVGPTPAEFRACYELAVPPLPV